MSITHAFVSAKEDGADETLVRPSDWNAAHSGSIDSKVIMVARDLAAASGDVSYTGVGFQPTCILALATIYGTSTASWGITDIASAGGALAQRGDGSMSHVGTPFFVFLVTSNDDTAFQSAFVKTYNADGFTLTWTKTGSPTGVAYLYILCLR